MAKKTKPTDEHLRSLEQSMLQAQKAMSNAIDARFPKDSSVLVQIRTNQKTLSAATVIWASHRHAHVRVRLQTKRQQVLDVHWSKVFSDG